MVDIVAATLVLQALCHSNNCCSTRVVFAVLVLGPCGGLIVDWVRCIGGTLRFQVAVIVGFQGCGTFVLLSRSGAVV